MKQYDVIIIGAGFAGLTLAHHLPKNLSILVIDQKKSLDALYESTGLVTTKTKQLLESFIPDLSAYLTNDIDTIGVITTDFQTHFFSSTETPWVFSTDTPRLIKRIGSSVHDNVEILLNAKFTDLQREHSLITIATEFGKERRQFKTKFLVGADGGYSPVSKKAKLSQNRKFLLGAEKVFYGNILLGEKPESSVYHYWFGEFSLGYGGWLSPTNINGKKAFRVGLAKLDDHINEITKLNTFIKKLTLLKHIQKNTEEIYSYAGCIPISGPVKKFYHDRVLLIGDAAGYCGAFAADGIKGAVSSAIVASNLIPLFFQNNDESIFQGFHDKMNEYNNLISYLQKQKLYRFIWNQMKKNDTFSAMYNVIAKEKEMFLSQFSDAKNTGSGMTKIILKPTLFPALVKYGTLVLRDVIFH